MAWNRNSCPRRTRCRHGLRSGSCCRHARNDVTRCCKLSFKGSNFVLELLFLSMRKANSAFPRPWCESNRIRTNRKKRSRSRLNVSKCPCNCKRRANVEQASANHTAPIRVLKKETSSKLSPPHHQPCYTIFCVSCNPPQAELLFF